MPRSTTVLLFAALALASCAAPAPVSERTALSQTLREEGLTGTVTHVARFDTQGELRCRFVMSETATSAVRFGEAAVDVSSRTVVRGAASTPEGACAQLSVGATVLVRSERPVRESYPVGVDADSLEFSRP